MKPYRFFGTEARVVGAVPENIIGFGAVINIPDDRLEAALLAGVQIIPLADADKLGFTAEEYRKYFSTELHSTAPQEFLAKRTAAWKAVHDFRESVLNPATPEPAVVPATPFAPPIAPQKDGE